MSNGEWFGNPTSGSLSIVIYLRRSSIDSSRTLVLSTRFAVMKMSQRPTQYAHDWNQLSICGLWWKVFEAQKKLATIIKCRIKLMFYLKIDLDYCILIYLKIADNDVDSSIFRYKYFAWINCTSKCSVFLFFFQIMKIHKEKTY